MTDSVITGKPPDTTGRPDSLRLLLNNSLATAGFAALCVIVLIALTAPILPLPDPNVTAPVDRLLPAFSAGHLLGTDALGRDILARLVWGTQVSLMVGISATLIAAFVGSLIGLVAGAVVGGGRVFRGLGLGVVLGHVQFSGVGF